MALRGTRKPRVSIKILYCLPKWGESSRSRIESILKHDHHVIWDAFKKLEDNRMIAYTRSTINAGRREFFFRITEDGLRTLILEIRLPQESWSIMLGYSRDMFIGLNPNSVRTREYGFYKKCVILAITTTIK
jgi:DNA-binding PadR family transcriptional regulator